MQHRGFVSVKIQVQQLQSEMDTVDGDLEKMTEQKLKNRADLLARQQKTKYYQKVKYTSISIAHFYAKRLKCAQTWITQFYLQITPCLPLLPSR